MVLLDVDAVDNQTKLLVAKHLATADDVQNVCADNRILCKIQ
jgi:hypothetical protein